MSHGSPKHSKMSNVFDPNDMLIPIDPWPEEESGFNVEKNDVLRGVQVGIERGVLINSTNPLD